MNRRRSPLPLLLLSLLALPLPAGVGRAGESSPVLAVVGARVLPVSGEPVEDGVILLSGGRIVAVGPRAGVEVPEGAEVVDAAGLTATPGLVDAVSGLYLSDEEAARGSRSADARAFDGVDPFHADVQDVLRAGVTAVFVPPPAGPGVNGAGVALRVRPDAPEAIRIPGASAVLCSLGLSRGRDAGPIARITEIRGIQGLLRAARAGKEAREKYEKDRAAWEKKAKEHEKKREAKEKETPGDGEAPAGKDGEKKAEEKLPDPPKPPRPNPAAEALVPVISREAPLFVRADGAQEILAALRLLDDQDVRLVLVGAAEAQRVLPDLVASRVPVLVGPLVSDDPVAAAPGELPRVLRDAGVPFAVSSFSRPGRASRFLALHAAAAARGGLTKDQALRAITLDAARIAGIDAHVGSLAAGREADVVLWTGHPVDTRSRPVRVIAGGETVWEERP